MTPSERRRLEMDAGRRSVEAHEARMSPEDLTAAETTARRMRSLQTLMVWEKEKKCNVSGLYFLTNPGSGGTASGNIEILRQMNAAQEVVVDVGKEQWKEKGHDFPSAYLFACVALAIEAGQHIQRGE